MGTMQAQADAHGIGRVPAQCDGPHVPVVAAIVLKSVFAPAQRTSHAPKPSSSTGRFGLMPLSFHKC